MSGNFPLEEVPLGSVAPHIMAEPYISKWNGGTKLTARSLGNFPVKTRKTVELCLATRTSGEVVH